MPATLFNELCRLASFRIIVHRANLMDQSQKPWQRLIIRKLGSQTASKLLALHGCFALHNEIVLETAVLSIAGVISITRDTFAHDYPEYFAPHHTSFLRSRYTLLISCIGAMFLFILGWRLWMVR